MTRVLEACAHLGEALLTARWRRQIRGRSREAIADLEEYLIKGRNSILARERRAPTRSFARVGGRAGRRIALLQARKPLSLS